MEERREEGGLEGDEAVLGDVEEKETADADAIGSLVVLRAGADIAAEDDAG